MIQRFDDLLARVRACRMCEATLPFAPRPILRAAPSARLLIVGQAPGTKVHDSGVPWNDASGNRLRAWLDVDSATFYDQSRIAIIPMGLCYPGRDSRSGGDNPPCPACAPQWHPPLLAALPEIRLTLLVGSHAQARYLGARRRPTMSQTVAAWREYLPAFLPLPHPSWRNTRWLRDNPWFERELVHALRAVVVATITL